MAKKKKSVHSFFGRIYGAPICFRFYLTFSRQDLFDSRTSEYGHKFEVGSSIKQKYDKGTVMLIQFKGA